MPKFHVHVYKVVAKTELDVEASNSKTAGELALKLVADGATKSIWETAKRDCDLLAITFDAVEHPPSDVTEP